MTFLPIYKGKTINRILCVIFSILSLIFIPVGFLHRGPGFVPVLITGGFALVYGILWAIWARKESRYEQELREAEEDLSAETFSPLEFRIPKERLSETAHKRLIGIIRGCGFIAIGVFVLIAVILLWTQSLKSPLQLLYLIVFSCVISVPGIIIQWIIYRKYVPSIPEKISLHPDKLVIDGNVLAARDINEIRISPDRVFNPDSPSIFREILIITDEGKKRCRIDFKAANAEQGQLRWEDYPLLARALKIWGKTYNVKVTTMYMQ